MERKIEVVLTTKLKERLEAKFLADPSCRVKIYESFGVDGVNTITGHGIKYILGELDSNFVFHCNMVSEKSLDITMLPVLYLDAMYKLVDGQMEELLAVCQSTGFYSEKFVNEKNPLVRIDSVIKANAPDIKFVFESMPLPGVEAKEETVDVKVINISKTLTLPKYETLGAAGMDLFANLEEKLVINPGERKLIPSGLKVALPSGWELDVRPKSGLALKKGITVLNAPGLIDEDFRGEIGVILVNHGTESVVILPGDKVAQIALVKVNKIKWVEVTELDTTERGEGGFGSTGR